jgi:hypothetical protein
MPRLSPAVAPAVAVLIAGGVFAGPAAAQDGLILTYALPDGSPMVQEISEHGIRADVPGGTSFYLPDRGLFLAIEMQGEQRVFAFDQFLEMMQGMTGAAEPEAMPDPAEVSIVDTGATEVVAGVEGTVYEITGPDGDGAVVVASNDAPMADLYNQMMGAYLGGLGDGLGAMAGADPAAGFQMFQDEPLGIILRAEGGMTLVSLQEIDADPTRFALPAEPGDISDMFQ